MDLGIASVKTVIAVASSAEIENVRADSNSYGVKPLFA
jgi:hypothetical protein